MSTKIKKYIKKNLADILMWLICGASIFWVLFPVLTEKYLSGWDLTSHFYLTNNMLEFLKDFRITGYDAQWFGGYPVFTFYGPLPYILIVLPTLLSFGVISLNLSFNFFLFLLPFLFLFSVFYTSRIWFGNKIGPYSLLFGIFFLFAEKEHAHFGLGINAEIYLGLFASIFAITLMIFLFGILGKLRQKVEKKYIFVASILLTAIILSHAMTTLFTGIVLGVLFLTDFKKSWKSLFIIFVLSLVLSSFWLIPFLHYLWLSSGSKIGLSPVTSDPIFILFPKIHEIFNGFSLSQLPGLVILIATALGIFKLIKTNKHFWPLSFIFTLIFLPRDYFVHILDFPIHYYRFTPHVFVLNIFIAAFGFEYLVNNISYFKKKFYRIILKIVILCLIVTSILVSILENFNINDDYNFYFEDYQHYASANEMLEYINEIKPKGRIATYSSYVNQFELGTPHFFSNFLPLDYDIPVLPGLLAESALSAEFIIPTLAKLVPDSLTWGKVSLLFDEDFTSQGYESMIKRLGLYNTQYLLISSVGAKEILKTVPNKIINFRNEVDPFTLLELTDYKPFIETTNYKPLLFVDLGGIDFRTFVLEWYKMPEIFDYPVIYTPKDLENISKDEMDQIGGLILSFPDKYNLSLYEYNEWESVNPNLIILNTVPEFNETSVETSTFINNFGPNIGSDSLKMALYSSHPTEIITNEIVATTKEDELLIFNSDSGTFINYSYFPRWKSKDPEQTIFWISPSMMFVFGKGETVLYYD